ncbi:carboxypeptidase-like regulatory domain-containing protein [Kordia sp.]|uniref:carboxypeptidase-like regulatory domain-containing protein n=1 Tax=Kordia sp. TaxID=1965332 RepID=UPI003D2C9B91
MSGTIKEDTTNILLSNANIIAEPQGDSAMKFSISNDKGYFELKLEKDETYKITISYLGYVPQEITYKAAESKTIAVSLKKDTESLGEVTLNYTPPVVIKKDTMSFKVDAFKTGDERKLRDILKNLPTVEVDKQGNVTIKGKKVSRVLVENKQFFTGDSKLAVNNIPADVVDKIEVLDNYSDVAFLKGLEDSDEMVMNVKLKEDKKKFVFGDIETATGIKERYILNPKIYYYSPKTSLNMITDFNNTGKKSFTFKDYLDFNGGISKLFSDTESYLSLFDNDFTRFLDNQNFIENTNQFNALNISHDFNEKLSLTGYSILSNDKLQTLTTTTNNYIASDNLIENRRNEFDNTNKFGIGKFAFSYAPDENTELLFETNIKASKNTIQGNILTESNFINSSINQNERIDDFSFRESVELHKQFNQKNTISVILNYNFNRSQPKTNWQTDQSFLNGLLPIEDETILDINSNKLRKTQSFKVVGKYYYVLNKLNHLYFTTGANVVNDNYSTFDFQRLQDGTINDFTDSNFGNQSRVNFNDIYFGVDYKFKSGIVTIKPSLTYHNFFWGIEQFTVRNNKSKGVLLPKFTTKVEFNSSKILSFNYSLQTRFPTITQFANRFTLTNFNNIYRGDETLENELYHNARISYYRFSMFKNIQYNLSVNYRKSTRNLKTANVIQGIDNILTPILLDAVDESVNVRGSLKKGYGKIKLSAKTNLSFSNFFTSVNDELIENTSNNYTISGGISTRFKDYPNISIGYNKTFSSYKANTNAKFENDVFNINLSYDFLNDFIFKVDYKREEFQNTTLNNTNTFDVANSSLFYQKDNSAWGFEISASNLFGVDFRQRNSFSNIVVSDERTFIQPRILLLKISYKL